MRYQIKKACKAANVPYKGQHSFRHTFATNYYNRGADVKILSRILGHSNMCVTYNVYSIFTGISSKRCKVSLAKSHKKMQPAIQQVA